MARLEEGDRIEQEPTVQPPPAGIQEGNHVEVVSYSQDYSTSSMIEAPPIGLPWTTGLFDCHEHPTNAILTAFFPCVTFGQIAEVLDEGRFKCPFGSAIYLLMMPALCSHWIMGSKYREKLRSRYNLVEAPYTDIVSHVFCPFCSLCQEFRELRNMGLDPALGWKGIPANRRSTQNHNQLVNVPPGNQSISRS